MDRALREKLGDSATEVFSTMYFMPVQLLDEVPEEDNWNLETTYIAANIAFSGPFNATVRMFFPLSMAHNIAEGFLGIDVDDITERQGLDTMQEAANMVIGSFLGRADPDGVCKLGIPKAEFINDFTPSEEKGSADLMAFSTEFGYMWLTYE